MLENKDEELRDIPKVEFTFMDEEKSEEERKKELEDLLKKRNELLASMGITPNNSDFNNESRDFPRHSR